MPRVWVVDVLNVSKAATIATIFCFAATYGFQTSRAYTYAALHLTYLLWFFLHQRLSPSWGRAVFGQEDLPLPACAIWCTILGPGYALPGYFAFSSTVDASPLVTVAAIMLFSWGSLINAAADFYKDGYKAAQPGAVVMGGPYRLARHVNWFGDWMRYCSFALISGSPWSLLIPGWTALLNLSAMLKRAEGQAARGGVAYEKYVQHTPAIIPWRLLF